MPQQHSKQAAAGLSGGCSSCSSSSSKVGCAAGCPAVVVPPATTAFSWVLPGPHTSEPRCWCPLLELLALGGELWAPGAQAHS
jgi:hypothetical protein